MKFCLNKLQVEFTPWIPGLPTVRLQFKPWALIVNLTSEEVYFGQWLSPAVEGTEASFTIPPKTVFSPTKMSFSEGRFRLGVELGGELLLSEKLRLSEEQRRTDIHHVNLDNVLPLNSFSRLDLVSQTGQHQVKIATFRGEYLPKEGWIWGVFQVKIIFLMGNFKEFFAE